MPSSSSPFLWPTCSFRTYSFHFILWLHSLLPRYIVCSFVDHFSINYIVLLKYILMTISSWAVPVPCRVCVLKCKELLRIYSLRDDTLQRTQKEMRIYKNFFSSLVFFAHNFISTNSTVCNVSVAFAEERWWLVFEEAAAPSMMEKYIKKMNLGVVFSCK